jgi:drug/metabolite transporter (DMT)-like permease
MMAESAPDVGPETRQSSRVWTYAWLATVPLTWGFNFVALKILYGTFHFTVLGLLAARYLLMVPLLVLLLLVTERDRRIRREHWRYLGIFALFTVGIYQYLFAQAIALTSAGESALLISSAPIWAFLITAGLGWEKPTGLGSAGVACGFVGIALVIFGGGKHAGVPQAHLLGDLVMLGAAVLWAAYAVFSRPLLRHYSPLKVTAWAHLLGSLLIVPVGWRQMAAVDWAGLPWPGWLWVLYFAWLAGVYGFVVWYRGVRALGSQKTMVFQYLVPPVALVVAYLVLREVPSPLQVLGVVLTLGGVYVASSARRVTP